MINATIKRIETTINETETLPDGRKKELLHLVADLKKEIGSLENSHPEQADSIISYTESSVREATRTEPDSDMLKHSLDGLTLSVRKFEVSHPTMTGIISNIGQVLGSIGI